MDSTRNQARWAGLLYGIASSLAPFSYLYVPGKLLVASDAVATTERVRASEGLHRFTGTLKSGQRYLARPPIRVQRRGNR